MAMVKTDATADGGLQSVQQLYDLIAGKTTTQSGGTTTKVETGSMDQAGMNAMLQQALSSTQGLAAVAGGQRTAGGYGSATNQLLVNDLMTRTAGQIAQANATKTTTASAPQTTTQTGGVSGEGLAKTAALLKGLQLFGSDKSGTNNLFAAAKKQLGFGSDTASAVDVGYVNPANMGAAEVAQSQGNPNYYSTSMSNMVTDVGLDTGSTMTDTGTETSSPDLTNWSDITPEAAGPGITETATDWVTAPDYVTQDVMTETAFADGGEVSAKKPGVLGSSQYSSVATPNPTGQGTTVNSPNVSAPQSTTLSSFANSIGSGGSQGNLGNGSGSISSLGGAPSLSQVGTVMGVVGTLAGNPGLANAGTVAGIAGARNPLGAAAMTAANIATKGVAGNVLSAVTKPTLANITDIAMAVSVPAYAAVNAALGLAGANSLGVAAQAAYTSQTQANDPTSMSDAFSPLTPVVQADVAMENAAAESDNNMSPMNDALTSVANESDDTMGALMGMTDSFGTNTGSGGGGFGNTAGPGGGFGGNGVSGGFGGGSSTSAADGGHIQGAGTGTSDSINAKLSDGETVITAQTTQRVKAMFGEDFFHKLEQQFNAPAAAAQVRKGMV